METALQLLAAFVLFDLLAAVLLIALVGLLQRRQMKNERAPMSHLVGVLLFLAVVASLIYGGVWMCLRSMV